VLCSSVPRSPKWPQWRTAGVVAGRTFAHEEHDPTQGARQGNDIGTQYRSAIYTQGPEQEAAAEAGRDLFQERLSAAGYGGITTEIAPLGQFSYAEDHHQQYLYKVPNGYCPVNCTGVSCPVGLPGV
jgi:peptide-methionine (S)-S-oxide reductase